MEVTFGITKAPSFRIVPPAFNSTGEVHTSPCDTCNVFWVNVTQGRDEKTERLIQEVKTCNDFCSFLAMYRESSKK